MRFLFIVLLIGLLPSLNCVAGTVEIDGKRFTLPDELTIEKVVEPPLADRPICADLDSRGKPHYGRASRANIRRACEWLGP